MKMQNQQVQATFDSAPDLRRSAKKGETAMCWKKRFRNSGVVLCAGMVSLLVTTRLLGQGLQIMDADLTLTQSPEPQKLTFGLPVADSAERLPAIIPSKTDLTTMELSEKPGMVVVTGTVLSKRGGEFALFNPGDEFTFYGLRVKVDTLRKGAATHVVLRALDLPTGTNPVIECDGKMMRIIRVFPDGTVDAAPSDSKGISGIVRGYVSPSYKGRFVLLPASAGVLSSFVLPAVAGSAALIAVLVVVLVARKSKTVRAQNNAASPQRRNE